MEHIINFINDIIWSQPTLVFLELPLLGVSKGGFIQMKQGREQHLMPLLLPKSAILPSRVWSNLSRFILTPYLSVPLRLL
jgi:hypothetical protein